MLFDFSVLGNVYVSFHEMDVLKKNPLCIEGKLFLKVRKVNTNDFSKWLLNSLMQVKMSEWVLVIFHFAIVQAQFLSQYLEIR